MKAIFASIIVILTLFASSAMAAGTVHWFWAKPIYTSDGLATLSTEVVRYDIDVDADDFINECQRLNVMIGAIALAGEFSNLDQFQAQVNRAIRFDPVLKNFRIKDVYVDER